MKEQNSKPIYMPDRYSPIMVIDDDNHTQEIRGKLPEYYFYFSINLNNLYFYKSPTKMKKDAKPMNRDEINQLFKEIHQYINPSNAALVKTVEVYCREKWKAEDAQTHTEQIFKPVQIATKQFNNSKELQRKAAQRDKILNKYTTVAPVIITDTDKNPTAVCAKLNEQIIYISLNEARPEFWNLSITGAKPMTMEDMSNFIGLIMESPKVEKACENIAPLYHKFIQSGKQRISSDYAGALLTQSREALAKGLNAFTPLERQLCEMVRNRSR